MNDGTIVEKEDAPIFPMFKHMLFFSARTTRSKLPPRYLVVLTIAACNMGRAECDTEEVIFGLCFFELYIFLIQQQYSATFFMRALPELLLFCSWTTGQLLGLASVT